MNELEKKTLLYKYERRILRIILLKLCMCEFLNREPIWEEFKYLAKIFEAKASDKADALDVALGMIGFDKPEELGENVATLRSFMVGDLLDAFEVSLEERLNVFNTPTDA